MTTRLSNVKYYILDPLISKYPSIMPMPLPNLAGPHDVSKEFLKAYLDRLTATTYKAPQTLASVKPHLRFNPYKR